MIDLEIKIEDDTDESKILDLQEKAEFGQLSVNHNGQEFWVIYKFTLIL